MLYTFDYDVRYTPSMPLAEIRIGKPFASPSLSLPAIVDSGADATMIPLRWLREIRARRSRKAWLNTPGGERRMVDLYAVSLQVGAHEQWALLVVGGRDVLNHLIVTLNGLAGVTEISQ